MSDDNMQEEYEKDVKDVILPQWLTDSFPEHLPWTVISYEDGVFHVSHDGSTFEDIVEAYDHASEAREDYQTVLDKSVDGHGGELMNGMFFCDMEDGAMSSRLLVSHTTEDTVTILKHDYLKFISELSVEYLTSPDDFVAAHNWLTYHPIFWKKDQEEKSFHWNTGFGLDDMDVAVWRERGETVVMLEAGAHVEPDYTTYYRDTRLIVKAPTYEEAIITLASRVSHVFDLDGNEREPAGVQ